MELNIWKEGGEGVLVCNRQLMTRDGVISWSSLAVLLFQVRIAWSAQNIGPLDRSQFWMLVRSEELEVDCEKIKPGSKVRVTLKVGLKQPSFLDMVHEIYLIRDDGEEKVGQCLVTTVFVQLKNQILGRANIPSRIQYLNNDIIPIDFQAKSKLFISQKYQKDKFPTWKMPLFLRYSDEDDNFHINHSSYFRFFSDAKLFVLQRHKSEKAIGPMVVLPPPHELIVRLARRTITRFSVSFHKEVKVLHHVDYFIIVQGNEKENALEFFICDEQDRVFTTGRAELSMQEIPNLSHL